MPVWLVGGTVAPELVVPLLGDAFIGMPPTVELDGVVGGKPGLSRFNPAGADSDVPFAIPAAGTCGIGEPLSDEFVPIAVVSDVPGVPLGFGDGATFTVVGAGVDGIVVDEGSALVDEGVGVDPDVAVPVPPMLGVSCASVGARSVRMPGGAVGAGWVRTRSPSGIPALAARGSASPESVAAASAIN